MAPPAVESGVLTEPERPASLQLPPPSSIAFRISSQSSRTVHVHIFLQLHFSPGTGYCWAQSHPSHMHSKSIGPVSDQSQLISNPCPGFPWRGPVRHAAPVDGQLNSFLRLKFNHDSVDRTRPLSSLSVPSHVSTAKL